MDSPSDVALYHKKTVDAIRKLDDPSLIICHPDWSKNLSTYLMNEDRSVTTTGAYGIPIVTDKRFAIAVVEFPEDPCMKEL